VLALSVFTPPSKLTDDPGSSVFFLLGQPEAQKLDARHDGSEQSIFVANSCAYAPWRDKKQWVELSLRSRFWASCFENYL
jgi:hypothetical protein